MLSAVLDAPTLAFSWAQVDSRLGQVSAFGPVAPLNRVNPNLLSRLLAEWRLRQACGPEDVVLCFHGLPPLFRLRGRAVVFVQNRILAENRLRKGYPRFVHYRLMAERLWFRRMNRNAEHYVVQSASMAHLVRQLVAEGTRVSVSPFVPADEQTNSVVVETLPGSPFDFVYAASGDAHKNHLALLEAWRLLRAAGLRPSLGLTLDADRDGRLWTRIDAASRKFDLDIKNLGWLTPIEVKALYRDSGALIYPSLMESLGLPLVEACDAGLPILASELDYVRDVVVPVESFDPSSPISIARAVRRYLGTPEKTADMHDAAAFLSDALL